jgi:hypothetical protein
MLRDSGPEGEGRSDELEDIAHTDRPVVGLRLENHR